MRIASSSTRTSGCSEGKEMRRKYLVYKLPLVFLIAPSYSIAPQVLQPNGGSYDVHDTEAGSQAYALNSQALALLSVALLL